MDVAALCESIATTKEETARLAAAETAERLGGALAEFTADPDNRSFAANYRPNGNYTRLLLNSPADAFQVVLVFWGPGQGSPIHDHDGTVGVVSALTGETEELKYRVSPSEGGVALAESGRTTISTGSVTPILPEDGKQLHRMVNELDRWAATVHIYLQAIHRFRVYEPAEGDLHRPTETELWFDDHEVGRRIPVRR